MDRNRLIVAFPSYLRAPIEQIAAEHSAIVPETVRDIVMKRTVRAPDRAVKEFVTHKVTSKFSGISLEKQCH